MEHIINGSRASDLLSTGTETGVSSASNQAYQILHLGFTVAPILAGLDKFFSLLVNWDQYLPAFVNNLTRGHGHELMYAVGVIEVIHHDAHRACVHRGTHKAMAVEPVAPDRDEEVAARQGP